MREENRIVFVWKLKQRMNKRTKEKRGRWRSWWERERERERGDEEKRWGEEGKKVTHLFEVSCECLNDCGPYDVGCEGDAEVLRERQMSSARHRVWRPLQIE